MENEDLLIKNIELKKEINRLRNDNEENNINHKLKIKSIEKELREQKASIEMHYDRLYERFKNYDKQMKQSITDEIKFVKDELIESAEQIFENAEFMQNFKKHIYKVIEDEVRINIKNADLHNYVGTIIKQYIRDNLKNTIEIIVKKIIETTNEKLRNDYRITKELTYSIDTQIRHTLMKLPCSAHTESILKERITTIINDISNNNIKMIE